MPRPKLNPYYKPQQKRVDENNPDTYCTCQECGQRFYRISATHLKKHNMTSAEYAKRHVGIPMSSKLASSLCGVREHQLIEKYGEIEGKKRWEQYCQKQSDTNTFEYKQKVHGWTKQQFDEYNDNRACTKENFIKRHGKVDGLRRWDDYCKVQSYVGVSIDYFVEKYGSEEGYKRFREINDSKSNSKEAFIKRYGLEQGLVKFREFNSNTKGCISRVSQNLFSNLDTQSGLFGEDEFLVTCNDGSYRLDFYDPISNKAIEFYGDYWHHNPSKHRPEFLNEVTGLTSTEQWAKDAKRLQEIKDKLGCQVLIIWESEYTKNPAATIAKCKQYLNS